MLLTRLRDYYGKIDFDIEVFIRNRSRDLTEETEDKVFQSIVENNPKENGIPNKVTLEDFLPSTHQKQPRIFYWSVCSECGCEFDYKFNFCPACFAKGKKVSRYTVRKSDVNPGESIVRYNLTHLPNEEGEKVCLQCSDRENSYCSWFGNSDHFCNNEEREYCPCKACCARYKKLNREYYDKKKMG